MKQDSNHAILRLVKETRPIRRWLVLAAFLSLGVIVCGMLAPKILGDVIQQLYTFWNKKLETGPASGSLPIAQSVAPSLLLLLALYALYGLCGYLKMLLLNNVVSRYFTCGLRIRISEKIKRLPISYLDSTPIGEILSRMTEDVSVMGNTVHTIFDIFITGFLQIMAISVVMFLLDRRQ